MCVYFAYEYIALRAHDCTRIDENATRWCGKSSDTKHYAPYDYICSPTQMCVKTERVEKYINFNTNINIMLCYWFYSKSTCAYIFGVQHKWIKINSTLCPCHSPGMCTHRKSHIWDVRRKNGQYKIALCTALPGLTVWIISHSVGPRRVWVTRKHPYGPK